MNKNYIYLHFVIDKKYNKYKESFKKCNRTRLLLDIHTFSLRGFIYF